jgi:hypothetical protein
VYAPDVELIMMFVDLNHYLVDLSSRLEVIGSTAGSHYYFGVGGDSLNPSAPKTSEYLTHYSLKFV